MEKDESLLVELRDKYRGRDWFHDAGFDQYGRPVVYIKHECHETLYDIPDKVGGKQLMVHFATSISTDKNSFVTKPTNGLTIAPLTQQLGQIKEAAALVGATIDAKLKEAALAQGIDTGFGQMIEDTAEQEKELELSVRMLTDELDRLERLCGSNILQDIFYEIQDGNNAVTNLSAKFPEVRQRLQKLYDKFGFDTIYEELDG